MASYLVKESHLQLLTHSTIFISLGYQVCALFISMIYMKVYPLDLNGVLAGCNGLILEEVLSGSIFYYML